MGLPEMFRGLRMPNSLSRETRDAFRKGVLHKLSPHFVQCPPIARVINSLDFKAIQALLSEDVRRSAHGARNPKNISATIVNKDEILFTNSEGYKALNADEEMVLFYFPPANLILVNIPRLIEETKLNPDIPPELFVAHAIIHEEVHASSSLWGRDAGNHRTVQTGYQQTTINKVNGRVVADLYRLLNEAVNESRAIEITRAYVKSNPIPGVTHEHLDRLADIYRYKHTSTEYFVGMHLLNVMIKKIAADTGVSEEVVRNGFVHGEAAGLNLDSKDARIELDFDSIFGRGFTKELATIHEGNLREFLEKYEINMDSTFMQAAERYARIAIKAYTDKHGRMPGGSLPGLPSSGNKGS